MSFSSFKKEKLCLFYERCPYKKDICSKHYPENFLLKNNCLVTCHLYKNKINQPIFLENE